jgi:hypothetical protein
MLGPFGEERALQVERVAVPDDVPEPPAVPVTRPGDFEDLQGLGAQVARFAEAEDLTCIAAFTEIETGKGSDARLQAEVADPARRALDGRRDRECQVSRSDACLADACHL